MKQKAKLEAHERKLAKKVRLRCGFQAACPLERSASPLAVGWPLLAVAVGWPLAGRCLLLPPLAVVCLCRWPLAGRPLTVLLS